MIDPSRTFETLHVGGGNHAAVAWFRRLVRHPGPSLLIRGPVGSGKTHLLHATANRFGTNAIIVSADAFRNGLIDALRSGHYLEYVGALGATPFLLVDDFESLASAPHTQELLERVLAGIIDAGGRVAIALGPTTAEQETRVREFTRRTPFVVLRWRAPCFEARVAALRATAAAEGLEVTRRDIDQAARGAPTVPEARAVLRRTALASQLAR